MEPYFKFLNISSVEAGWKFPGVAHVGIYALGWKGLSYT